MQAEKLSINELEEHAISQSHFVRKQKEELDNDLKTILFERQIRLNNAFVFTPENIEKILDLNRRLMDCFEKLRDEGLKVLQELEMRMANNDSFLQDYEIEGQIIPFIMVQDKEDGYWYEPDDGILCLLNEKLDPDLLSIYISGLENAVKEDIHFDKSLNWNNLIGARNGELSGYYICYGMRELYNNTFYSLSDILQINELWIEIRIRHQKFIEFQV